MTASRSERQRRLAYLAGPLAVVKVESSERTGLIFRIRCNAGCVRRGVNHPWSTYEQGKKHDNGYLAALDRWTLHLHWAHPGAEAPCLEHLANAKKRLDAQRVAERKVLADALAALDGLSVDASATNRLLDLAN